MFLRKELSQYHANILAITFLLSIMLAISLHTCYTEDSFVLKEKEAAFTVDKRYVGFYAEISINNSDDYGYALLIFTGEGIFAYGFYMEKRSSEKDMLLYRVSGDQNRWFFLGKIPFYKPFTLAVFIDTKDNKVYYRLNNSVIEDSLKGNYEINMFHIIINNIDNQRRPPCILAKIVIVFKSDTLTKDIIYNYTDTDLHNFLQNQSIILLLEKQEQTTTSTTTTITSSTSTPSTTTPSKTTTATPISSLNNINEYIILAIIITGLIIVVLILKRAKRSHGP